MESNWLMLFWWWMNGCGTVDGWWRFSQIPNGRFKEHSTELYSELPQAFSSLNPNARVLSQNNYSQRFLVNHFSYAEIYCRFYCSITANLYCSGDLDSLPFILSSSNHHHLYIFLKLTVVTSYLFWFLSLRIYSLIHWKPFLGSSHPAISDASTSNFF